MTDDHSRPLSNFRGFDSRMDDDWPLTTRAIEACERANGGIDFTDDDEPVRGNALLRALAAASEGRIVEIRPGFWYESKLPPA